MNLKEGALGRYVRILLKLFYKKEGVEAWAKLN
jgi:hypothetical protein